MWGSDAMLPARRDECMIISRAENEPPEVRSCANWDTSRQKVTGRGKRRIVGIVIVAPADFFFFLKAPHSLVILPKKTNAQMSNRYMYQDSTGAKCFLVCVN